MTLHIEINKGEQKFSFIFLCECYSAVDLFYVCQPKLILEGRVVEAVDQT